jgi:hypothetical protein
MFMPNVHINDVGFVACIDAADLCKVLELNLCLILSMTVSFAPSYRASVMPLQHGTVTSTNSTRQGLLNKQLRD